MILARHGQTPFNVAYGATRTDPGIEDPGLTEEGRAQAETLARSLAGLDLRRIEVSPYRRTLETAAIVNAALSLPMTIEPRVRERQGFICDIGRTPEVLLADWPTLDFGALGQSWWCEHTGEAEEPLDHFDGRVRAFREQAGRMSDAETTLVVTHWGVIRALTGLTVGNAAMVRFDPGSGAGEIIAPA